MAKHEWFNPGDEPDPEIRERLSANLEYERGRRDAERYLENRRLFGEAYADAEEFAWDLKDPDPYY